MGVKCTRLLGNQKLYLLFLKHIYICSLNPTWWDGFKFKIKLEIVYTHLILYILPWIPTYVKQNTEILYRLSSGIKLLYKRINSTFRKCFVEIFIYFSKLMYYSIHIVFSTRVRSIIIFTLYRTLKASDDFDDFVLIEGNGYLTKTEWKLYERHLTHGIKVLLRSGLRNCMMKKRFTGLDVDVWV